MKFKYIIFVFFYIVVVKFVYLDFKDFFFLVYWVFEVLFFLSVIRIFFFVDYEGNLESGFVNVLV